MYGRVAVAAARACAAGNRRDPNEEWQAAVELATSSQTSRNKGCPRHAFLGLCEEGMVKGVSRGVYLRPAAWKNKQYAVTAARWLLEHDESAGVDEDLLWLVARRGVADPAANENGQINVVVSLRAAGLLVQPGRES